MFFPVRNQIFIMVTAKKCQVLQYVFPYHLALTHMQLITRIANNRLSWSESFRFENFALSHVCRR